MSNILKDTRTGSVHTSHFTDVTLSLFYETKIEMHALTPTRRWRWKMESGSDAEISILPIKAKKSVPCFPQSE